MLQFTVHLHLCEAEYIHMDVCDHLPVHDKCSIPKDEKTKTDSPANLLSIGKSIEGPQPLRASYYSVIFTLIARTILAALSAPSAGGQDKANKSQDKG